ncbi:energy-converting hydrogenase Eha subunit A [Arthrobacter oryzae]|jgi:energy-converting hydrogenase Eha subunit A|nr:energy-converting hydrogenase Eha subunit A [Arthrobacter oryzae]
MLSLILLITAGLLTSSSAVLQLPSTTRECRRRKFKGNFPLQISAGILALGAVLLAVNIQLGAIQ